MKNLLLAGICLFSSILNAQLTGSEWIDFTKPHLKYKTDQEELVRINFFAAELGLLKLGTRIQSVPMDKYRVFSHGQQIPLLITDLNKNNTWDPDDYIEFVTHKEDGHFDSLLYEDKRHQRHKLQSMYTDFRAYYLTYRDNGVQAKYSNATATPPSTDPPKASHQSVVTQFGDDLYFSGKLIFLGGTAASLSDYTFGEGFYGPRLNVPRTSIPAGFRADSSKPMITIPIIAPEIDSSGFKPMITVGTVNSIAYYSFFSHWLIYKVSPNGSSNNRRIGDTITKQNVHVVQSLDLHYQVYF